MLQDLLTEINFKITDLEGLREEYVLPTTGTPGTIIQGYMEQHQRQRDITRQIDDLTRLRDTIQTEIDRLEAEKLAAKQKAEAEERARFVTAETT